MRQEGRALSGQGGSRTSLSSAAFVRRVHHKPPAGQTRQGGFSVDEPSAVGAAGKADRWLAQGCTDAAERADARESPAEIWLRSDSGFWPWCSRCPPWSSWKYSLDAGLCRHDVRTVTHMDVRVSAGSLFAIGSSTPLDKVE